MKNSICQVDIVIFVEMERLVIIVITIAMLINQIEINFDKEIARCWVV